VRGRARDVAGVVRVVGVVGVVGVAAVADAFSVLGLFPLGVTDFRQGVDHVIRPPPKTFRHSSDVAPTPCRREWGEHCCFGGKNPMRLPSGQRKYDPSWYVEIADPWTVLLEAGKTTNICSCFLATRTETPSPIRFLFRPF